MLTDETRQAMDCAIRNSHFGKTVEKNINGHILIFTTDAVLPIRLPWN